MRTPLLALLLVLAALVPGVACAREAPTDCIGLVLGGGGARGMAHIGVLKVLERERVPICAIAGTSMGSIVGGLYAAGYNPEEIEALMASLDWKGLLDDDPPREDLPMRRKNDQLRYLLDFKLGLRDGAVQFPRGVLQGQKLLLLLRRFLMPVSGIESFDELPIPFRCVATDIGRGEGVVYDHGDLALAIRASMSVPAAFAPMRVEGRLVVDGGIVDNVPVDVVKAMGATRVIVVDVSAPLAPEEKLDSPLAITAQMLDMLMRQRTEQVLAELGPDDVLIRPDLGDLGSADFDRALSAIPIGEQAGQAEVARLRAFGADEAGYAAFQRRQAVPEFDAPVVEFLNVVQNRSRTSRYIDNRLEPLIGEPLDFEDLETRIGSVYGAGWYERILWSPERRDGEFGLRVTPVDKGWGPNFITVGLQLSDDFEGTTSYQLGVEYTATGLNSYGGEWRTRGEIGRVVALRTEFFQPMGAHAQYWLEPSLDYRAEDQAILGEPAGSAVASYRVRRARAALLAGYEPSPTSRLFGGLRYSDSTANLKIGSQPLPDELTSRGGAIVMGFTRDTLDDADFPSRGTRVDLGLDAYRDALGSLGNGEVFDANWDTAFSRGQNRYLVGARAHVAWGTIENIGSLSRIGGLMNLSGYEENALIGTDSALVRAIYYRQITDSRRLFSVPLVVGGSLEAGNVWNARGEARLDELIYAGSVFLGVKSPFGPIFLGYGRADTGASSFYLNFSTLLRPDL